MKVLITGVNGFLGGKIAAALKNIEAEIIGLGQSGSPKYSLDKYVQGSVLDQDVVDQAIEGVDIVIHLAAITEHTSITSRKFETLSTNFEGTKNVLNSFISSPTASKFIFSSTGKVYGVTGYEAITEEKAPDPKNILGKSKHIVERLIDFYLQPGKSFVSFRIFQAYGSNQKDNFLLPTILKQIDPSKKNSQTIELGDIKAKRDYVHVKDVCEAFVRACIKDFEPNVFHIFNLSTGIPTSAEQIVRIIEREFGLDINIDTDIGKIRADEAAIEFASYEKARSFLGWAPVVKLDDGVIEVARKSWT